MSNKQIHLLFLATFIGLFITYGIFFNTITIVGIILDEMIFIGILIAIILFSLYYKRKLRGYSIVDFNKDSSMSFQSIVLFFVVFQVMDYVLEDGFIGMISMWFSYWVFGYIAFFILDIINTYKNLKLIKI